MRDGEIVRTSTGRTSTRAVFDRRTFLRGSVAEAGAFALGPSWLRRAAARSAAGREERVLVVLELRGGNDGLNTLVPIEDERYFRARPELALTKEDVLPLDSLNGLHPSLAHCREWFGEGSLAIVQQVGYPRPNLSHFASSDVWESATADEPRPAAGWLGQWRDRAGEPWREEPLAMLALGTGVLPYALRGSGVRAPAAWSLPHYRFQTALGAGDEHARERRETLEALYRAPATAPELEHVQQVFELARRSSEELVRASERATPEGYPPTKLGRDLCAVANVIARELPVRVFHVAHCGFDTHIEQLEEHAKLLAQLDQALHAFLSDLRAQQKLARTLVLTVSEFGRRAAESGLGSDAGTDHGAASCLLLAGGGVRGGVHGGQPDLAHLDETGNLVHAVDFRRVYATVLERWLGADSEGVLGARFEPLEVLRS